MRKVTGLMIASLAVWGFCVWSRLARKHRQRAATVKPAEPPAAPPQDPPCAARRSAGKLPERLAGRSVFPPTPSPVNVPGNSGKAKALGVMSIEGFSSQKVSAEIAKNLDANLSPDELTAIKARLTALHLYMPCITSAMLEKTKAPGASCSICESSRH